MAPPIYGGIINLQSISNQITTSGSEFLVGRPKLVTPQCLVPAGRVKPGLDAPLWPLRAHPDTDQVLDQFLTVMAERRVRSKAVTSSTI